MAFNSFGFLLFFPIVALVTSVLPARRRWLFLLGASYLFFMAWRVEHIFLILITTGVGYFTAKRIETTDNPTSRRRFLWLSVLVNIGLLALFRYFNFINGAFRTLFQVAGTTYPIPDLQLTAPLGISFYTLQVLGYSIDVYFRRIKAEQHLGIFALFVAFFPQLAAGPIERANRMLPQFKVSRSFDYERIVSGSLRILWGFFKKLVIADRLALLVNTIYNQPTLYAGNPLILGTYAFALQIYCDFSAYSDIAIGVARILGFDLMENFKQPYFSQSINDFWRHWHISLSSWLRDYVFYPLRRLTVKTGNLATWSLIPFVIPAMATMLASGLWHGAHWTFVLWGGVHGLLIVWETVWARYVSRRLHLPKLPEALATGLRIGITFHVICLTWIIFRANSVSDALYIVQHLFVNLQFQSFGIGPLMPGGKYELSIVMLALLLMAIVEALQRRQVDLRAFALRRPIWMRWAAYYALFLIILMFGEFGLVEFFYVKF